MSTMTGEDGTQLYYKDWGRGPAVVFSHGEDDQIVPVHASANKSVPLIESAQAIYYPGAPHGLTATHRDRLNADLLEFVRG